MNKVIPVPYDFLREPIRTMQKRNRRLLRFLFFVYLGGESNPYLTFRRGLFYPLNYQGKRRNGSAKLDKIP